jgi:hypothetical protein
VKFVADENVDRQIVDGLRADGHAVFYVAELEPSIPDAFVVVRANSVRVRRRIQ